MTPESSRLFLIGGSSSVGKTTLARTIAARLGVILFQVDAIAAVASNPIIQFPGGMPDPWHLAPEKLRDGLIAKGEALARHLDGIVISCIEAGE